MCTKSKPRFEPRTYQSWNQRANHSAASTARPLNLLELNPHLQLHENHFFLGLLDHVDDLDGDALLGLGVVGQEDRTGSTASCVVDKI